MTESLDPNIILAGQYTTHPVAPPNIGDIIEQGQRTGLLAAQRGQTQVLTQEEQQKIALQQMQLQNQTAWGQATMQVIGGLQQQRQASMAGQTANNAQTGSNGVPGTVPVTGAPAPVPPGVDPSWHVNPATDWYEDSDGNPVSHAAGPAFSPSGRPNLFSHEVMNQIAGRAQQLGANPMFLAQQFAEQSNNALAFDKSFQEIHKSQADAAEAQARADNSRAQTASLVMATTRNQADGALLNPDVSAQTHNALMLAQQMPKFWGPKLQAAGVQVATDPQSGVLIANTADPHFLQVFAQDAQASSNFQNRQKQQAEIAAQGIHTVQGVDPSTGLPTSTLVQTKPDGKGGVITTVLAQGSLGTTVNGRGGAAPAPTANAGAPGTTSAGQYTLQNGSTVKSSGSSVIDSMAEGVASYKQNIQNVPAKFRPAVQQQALLINPDYDQTQYNLKNQARTLFQLGKPGTPGGNLVAIDTAINHLDLWQQAAQALQTGDTTALNRIYNKLGANFGDGNVTAAKLVSDIAADEVVKAVVGNISGEAERQQMQHLLDATGLAPDQVAKNFSMAQGLMAGRLEPLVNTAEKAGLTSNDLALSPPARRLLAQQASQNAQQPSAAATPTANPQISKIQKMGDVLTDSAGTHWMWDGKGPKDQKSSYVNLGQ